MSKKKKKSSGPSVEIRNKTVPVKTLSGPERWAAFRMIVSADELERDLTAVYVLGKAWAYVPAMPPKDLGESTLGYARRCCEAFEAEGYTAQEYIAAAWDLASEIVQEFAPPTEDEVQEAEGN